MNDDLFSASQHTEIKAEQPLAERARPQTLHDFVGQSQVFGDGHLLKNLFVSDRLPSLILWGPPGTGKTSFAHLVSQQTKSTFINRSAIDTGAKDLKQEGEEAKQRLLRFHEKTILFIDEIHRLNKAQQDVLLPFVERGFLSLIGATTENPSFELNSALLSRCHVIVFEGLGQEALEKILDRGLNLINDKLRWSDLSVEVDIKQIISQAAAGDGRRALNLLESIVSFWLGEQASPMPGQEQDLEREPGRVAEWGAGQNRGPGTRPLRKEQVEEALRHIPIRYDKSSDMHYDTISAFIKSIRGSDPDAALFYLARMLKGGEAPLFIARRLVILASEDIGNADPRALQVALNVKDAVEFVGLPEAAINLAQGVTYLATTPKSNRSYMGLLAAQELVEQFPHAEVPLALRNAQTSLMKKIGYGKDYNYPHNSETGVTPQSFMPEVAKGRPLYKPTNRGHEKNVTAYMEWVRAQLAAAAQRDSEP